MSSRNTRGGKLVVNKSILTLAAAAALPLIVPGWASGQATFTWDNDTVTAGAQDGAGNWDTATANWYNGANNLWTNGGADTAVFGAGSIGGAINLATTINFNGLTFNNTGYTLSGGALNLGGTSPANITANASAQLNTAIAGAAGLDVNYTVAPGATFSMSVANTYAGNTTITGGGTVNLNGGSGSFASFGGGSVTLNGAAIRWRDQMTLQNAIYIPLGSTGTLNLVANGTLSGSLTGAGTAILSSSGAGANTVFSFNGNNSGSTSLTGFQGWLSVGSATYLRVTNANAGNAAAVFDLATYGTGSIGPRASGTIQLGAVLAGANNMLRGNNGSGAECVFEIGGHASVDSYINGPIILGSSGARILTLSKIGADRTLTIGSGGVGGSGSNTLGGSVYINAGTLALSATGSLTSVTKVQVNAGTFDVSAVNGGYTQIANQPLFGNGNVKGSVTLPASTTVNPGGIGSAGSFTFHNDLNLTGGELRFDLANNTTVGGFTNDYLDVKGALDLASGTMFFNPYVGTFAVGTYTIGSYGTAPSGVANPELVFGQRAIGAVYAESGLLKLNIASIGTGSNDMVWNGTANGDWKVSGDLNFFNNTTAAQDAFFTGDHVTFNDPGVGVVTTINKIGTLQTVGSLTFNNTAGTSYTIGGSGTIVSNALAKFGGGTVILNSPNNFGSVVLGGTGGANFGTLRLDNASALGSASVTIGRQALIIGTESTVANPLYIARDVAVIGGNGTFSGVITSAPNAGELGNVNVSIPLANQTISVVPATFGSGFTGTVNLGSSPGAFRWTGTTAVSTPAKFDLGTGSAIMYVRDGNAGQIAIGALAGGANTTLRGANSTDAAVTFTIGSANVDSTFAGTITDGTNSGTNDLDSTSIVKTGSGILTFDGNNTYRGTTTVSGGALIVNGSHIGAGAYTVAAGATIGGNGAISAQVNAAGANIAPGASVGVLAVGSLSTDASTLQYEFGSEGGDGIIVTNSGGLNTGASASTVNLAGSAIAGQYPLIDYAGSTAGAGSYAIGTNTTGLTATLVTNAAGSSMDVQLAGGGPKHEMWNVDANGTWGTGGNWTESTSPNGVDYQAYFGSVISTARNVNAESAKTVARMHFNADSAYTVGGSSITLDSSTGAAGINVYRGSHTISAPLVLGDDTSVAVKPTSALTVSGDVSGGSGLIKTGRGNLVLAGTNSYSGTTTVSQGTLTLNGTHTGGGAYNVANAAALGGTGATDAQVNLVSAAILAPGASVGVITVGGLSLTNASLRFELDASGADKVVVNGGLTLSGVSTFSLTDLGGALAGQYSLIDYTGSALADLSNFALSSASVGSFAVALVNNTANTSVDVKLMAASSWAVDSDGSWSTASNWFANVQPNAENANAYFSNVITATRTVTVDANRTVGAMYFDDADGYILAGSSTITLNVGSGNAQINVTNGSHTISAPLSLGDDLDVTVSNSADTLTLSNYLYAPSRTVNKAGDGTVQVDKATLTALNVNAGKVKISAKGTPNDPTGTSVLTALTIASGAQLDLTNNSMVVDYATGTGPNLTLENEIRQHLQADRLTSSSAAGGTKLGYGDNAVLNKPSHGGLTVDADAILIKFTYAGDANLDGQVTISDLGDLASNWQSTSAVWRNGDFNYDGQVTISDLGDLASNWQAGVGSPLGMSFQEALAAVGFDGAAVPEPATLGLLGVAMSGLMARRRRV